MYNFSKEKFFIEQWKKYYQFHQSNRLISCNITISEKQKYKYLFYLQKALYNYENRSFDAALEDYLLIYKSKYIKQIYRDFAKLMSIKIQILTKLITNSEGIKLYNNYYQNTQYFKNIAIISESILFVNLDDKYYDKEKLKIILSNNESSNLLLYITKILSKRYN
jgi:hypothetical protein